MFFFYFFLAILTSLYIIINMKKQTLKIIASLLFLLLLIPIHSYAGDFNRNGKIEKNYKFNFYFGNSKGNVKVHMADIARETINEWEHLIYKPEENNMVTENTKVITAEGYEIDPLYEPPFEAYWFLGEDEPNKYNLDGIIIYNENDDQFYDVYHRNSSSKK